MAYLLDADVFIRAGRRPLRKTDISKDSNDC